MRVSTGGGIKVSRVIMMLKSVKRELNAYLHPKSVRMIKMEGKALDQGAISSVAVYFITFYPDICGIFPSCGLGRKRSDHEFYSRFDNDEQYGTGAGRCWPIQEFWRTFNIVEICPNV